MSINTANFGITSDSSVTNQYLLFQVNEDTFCVKVDLVNQIEIYDKHFPVPSSPDYVIGVAKTRGKIVTLVHLGRRLNLNKKLPKKEESHIIYLERGNDKILGMVVDRVTDLVNIPKNFIKEDLDMINTSIPLDFLKGAATLDDAIVILLNFDLVLSNFEIEELSFNGDMIDKELDENLEEENISKYDLAGSEEISYSTDSQNQNLDEDDELFSSVAENSVEETPTSDTEDSVEETPTSDTEDSVEETPTSDTEDSVEETSTSDTEDSVEETSTSDKDQENEADDDSNQETKNDDENDDDEFF